MSDILTKLKDGIIEIFPEAEDMDITEETELGALPDWDSMASVNLQSFIEQNFQVTIPQDMLSEETNIGEIIEYIREPEKIKQTA